MPNTKQAQKRLVQDDRRRLANKAKRSQMRSAMKQVLLATDAETAKAALPLAIKKIDKAAKVNIIHDNNAARKKARLARHVAGL